MTSSQTGAPRRIPVGLLYIAPWIIGFAVFQLYPLLSSLYFSFTQYSLLGGARFVGVRNFVKMLTQDVHFWNSLRVTFIYVGTSVPLKLLFSLIIAMIMNQPLRGINLFRTIYYIPSILGGSVALSILWRYLFMQEGYVNYVLSVVSLGPIDFLGSPRYALGTLVLLEVWQFGSSMVIFLAALKQVPRDLIESATIDGAGRIRKFISVTLPFVTPMIFFNFVMQMVIEFQNFTPAFVITRGGPINSTRLFVLHIYENGFTYSKMGYASALSWVLFVVLILMTVVVFKSSPYWTYYEDAKEF